MKIFKNFISKVAADCRQGWSNVNLPDSIISVSIGLVFFLTPLFFTGLTAQGVGFDKMILFYFLTLIGVVAWMVKGVMAGELNLRVTPLDIPFAIAAVIFVISAIFSVAQKDSWLGSYGNSARGLAAFFVFGLFYYLVVNNINGAKIKQWFWALVASGSLLTIFSLLQLAKIFVIPAKFTHFIGFNPIGSSSGLTMFLVICLPLFSVAITHLKEIQPKMCVKNASVLKIFLSVAALADLAVLALLNGFTFWPAAIAGMVIVLMFSLSKVVPTANKVVFAPLVIFLASIMLLVLGNFNLVRLEMPVEVSLSGRASWDIAKSSLRDNPIFGSGPATFYYDFSKFRAPALNYSQLWDVRFNNASGIIFEMLASVGALGTLGVIVVTLIALSVSFTAIIKTDRKEERPIMLGFFASFVTFIIFALLFSFNNSLMLLLALVSILTISSAISISPDRFKTLNLSFRATANYALALAAILLSVSAGMVVLFVIGLKIFMADVYMSQAIASAEADDKISKLTQAINLNPYEDAYYLGLSRGYLALADSLAQTDKDQALVAANLNLAIESGKKAVEINPNSAGNIEALALAYENASFYVRGSLESAEDLYNKQMVLEPTNPVPYLRLASINMTKANLEEKEENKKTYLEEAIKNYDKALAKKNNFGPAYYGKAMIYERMDKLTEAIEELKKAVLSASDELNYRFELARLLFGRGVRQPDAAQSAPAGAIKGEVAPSQAIGGVIQRNNDLNSAEQIFKSILLAAPDNANSLYSLALLYQKTGESDKARAEVRKLLEILPDEQQKERIRNQFPGLY